MNAMATPALQLTRIDKQFLGVRGLKGGGLRLRLFPGEVHALMGQNGADKSTLVQVLTGVYSADRGEMFLSGPQGMPRHCQRRSSASARSVKQ
jgi:galactofuranose transport system ATP-binding protein